MLLIFLISQDFIVVHPTFLFFYFFLLSVQFHLHVAPSLDVIWLTARSFPPLLYNFFFLIQIATDEKDSILASIPADLKEKGSTLYASLIDGKVYRGTLAESAVCEKGNFSCTKLTLGRRRKQWNRHASHFVSFASIFIYLGILSLHWIGNFK